MRGMTASTADPTTLSTYPCADEWREMPFAGPPYAVSSRGMVKNTKTGKILKQQEKASGYLRVALNCHGKLRQLLVHRVVYIAFAGPIPDGMEINHIDGNKRNNHIGNLEAVTPEQHRAATHVARRYGVGMPAAEAAPIYRRDIQLENDRLEASKRRPMATPDRPVWPYPDIVKLTAHMGSGQWRKRHKGKDFYFGPLADPDGALANWRANWPRIVSGTVEQVRATRASVTLAELALEFVRAKKAQMDRGELEWSSFREYREIAQMVIDTIGQDRNAGTLAPRDFAKLTEAFARYSPIKRRNLVTKVRTIFKWAKESELLEELPNYGPDFKGPPSKVIRKHKREQGERWFEPDQIHKILNVASPQLKAMVLLGINCGMGNRDIGQLPKSAIDFKAKILSHHRTKTEAERRAPLWPETIAAIRALPKHDYPTLFITDSGLPVSRDGTDMVGRQFQALTSAIGIDLRFYDLRRTFATVAAQSVDKDARKIIMGHTIDGVHDDYVQRFPEDRLRAVSDLVRQWLFAVRNRPKKPRRAAS